MRALALAVALWLLATPALAAEALFSWKPVPGAVSYRLYRCTANCWPVTVQNWSLYGEFAGTEARVTYSGLTFWILTAKNSAGETPRLTAGWWTQ